MNETAHDWFAALFAVTPAQYVESVRREIPQVKNRFDCFICKIGDSIQTYYRPGFEKRI